MTRSIEEFSEILQREASLAPLTWLRVGGPAEYLLTPRNEAELLDVLHVCRAQGIPVHILGSGSNLLVRDAGVRGAVIRVTEPVLAEISISDTQEIGRAHV